MPRVAKDKEKVEIKDTTKKTKTTSAKKSTTKKSASINLAEKSTKKNTTKKSSSTSKSKNTNVKKNTKKSTKTVVKKPEIMEYYDLPYRYNQTTVKLLAQTPTSLFIYWDISDKDRQNFIEKYGDKFFEYTKPVLIITNETKNYTFEVDINDYANSWYLHVTDDKCKYKIELGRRSINDALNLPDNYIYIDSSNEIEAPNNHILFDELESLVFFKDVKNDKIIQKDISSLSFIKKIGKLYNIYDLYKQMYKDEIIGDEFGLNTISSSRS